MAENIEPGQDQVIPQAPVPGAPAPNGAAREGEDGGGEELDAKAIKAELDKARKQLGQLLNEKGKWTKAEQARRELADQLKAWNDVQAEHHIDPAQLRDMLKAREEAELGEAKSKGDVEKLLANRDQKHARDLAKKDEERAALAAKYEAERELNDKLLVDLEIRAELARMVEPALMKGAFALHRPKAKAIEDDEAEYGRRVVIEVDGDHMLPKDFLKAWAETDPEAQAYLIGNRSQGGGAPPGGRAGPGGPRMQRSKMTAKAKADYMNQYGVDLYNKLPW